MKVIYQTAVGVVILAIATFAAYCLIVEGTEALIIILGIAWLIIGGYLIGRSMFGKGQSDEGSEPNAYWKKQKNK